MARWSTIHEINLSNKWYLLNLENILLFIISPRLILLCSRSLLIIFVWILWTEKHTHRDTQTHWKSHIHTNWEQERHTHTEWNTHTLNRMESLREWHSLRERHTHWEKKHTHWGRHTTYRDTHTHWKTQTHTLSDTYWETDIHTEREATHTQAHRDMGTGRES